MKIVHTADLHLGSPLTYLSGHKKQIRQQEMVDVFDRIIKFTIEYKADLLIIAGDLFDKQKVEPWLIEYLARMFNQLTNTRVFISPGNHDAYTADFDNVYNSDTFPSFVHVFKSGVERVECDGYCVWGSNFNQGELSVPSLDGGINILVLHSDLQDSDYNLITPGQQEFDYIALGHRHSFSGIQKDGKVYYAYPGTPEPHGFDECGEKGLIYGTISEEKIDLVFKPMAKRQYYLLEQSVEDLTIAQLIDTIVKKMNASDLYSVVLTGESSHINLPYIKNQLEDKCFFVKIADKTNCPANENSAVIKIFRQKLSNSDSALHSLALQFGLAALNGLEVTIPED